MTINASELVSKLQDEDEHRRLREIIDDLDFPSEDEQVELTDHSGISMI